MERQDSNDGAGSGRPRMEDIARLSGVSVSTVSRALAGSARVTGETRARIEAAVRETGYVVNQVARGLRLQRSRQLLVLLPTIANPFFADIVLGVEEEARAAGYGVLVGSTEGDAARAAAHARQLLTGAVDGLILLTGRLPEGLDEGQPIVAVSETIGAPGLPSVGIDNQAAAAAAVAHLRGLGHARIGHIAGPAGNVLTGQRIAGWREAGAGLALGEPAHGDFTMVSGAAAARRLLAASPRPTALFCANDEMAIGAMRAARELGLSVPGDLSIVGFDDIAFAAFADPPLTTIRQPRREFGRVAAGMLIGGEARPMRLDFELVVRGSAGGVRERRLAG